MNPREPGDGAARVNKILDLLGGKAVLLPIRAGVKKPELQGWTLFGLKEMDDPAYLERFNNGGNIGVLLGKNSGGLCTIDIDDDKYIELFLQENPVLRGTLRTKRLKGCNFWMWVTGDYPGVTPFHHARLHNEKGKPLALGEWRATGGQTVIQGQADGIPYKCEVDAKPIRIEFTDIIWPSWIDDPPHVEITQDKSEPSASSLDHSKLTILRRTDSGYIWAACPACRDAGEDAAGNHLLITPEGKFGCAKYPKNKDHRKLIWKLAGIPKPKPPATDEDVPEWIDRYFGDSKDKPVEPLTILTFEQILELKRDENDRILGDHLLDKGSPLVIAGQGGTGKTRILIQFIATIKMAFDKFLTFQIHPGAENLRFLIIQSENSPWRLQDEAKKYQAIMSEEAWALFNSTVFTLCPTKEHDSMLNLNDHENVARIKLACDTFKPDVVVSDPLGDLSTGDLSKDVDMKATITALSRTVKYGNPKRSLIILHHALTGQAGHAKAVGVDRASFARNSKVLFNWTRAQINVAPISPDNNDQLSISCGKCSDGKEFIPFAVNLNPSSLLYECDPSVDIAAWASSIKSPKSSKSIISSVEVRHLCDLSGSSRSSLAKAISEHVGCDRSNSYRYIRSADKDSKIKWSDHLKLYFKN